MKSTLGYQNIFPIANADEYRCSIEKYATGHSLLYVSVDKGTEFQFHLLFLDVRYFSGSPRWQGVNFHLVETPDPNLLDPRVIKFHNSWSESNVSKKLNIYRASTSGVDVFIAAVDVVKIDSTDS